MKCYGCDASQSVPISHSEPTADWQNPRPARNDDSSPLHIVSAAPSEQIPSPASAHVFSHLVAIVSAMALLCHALFVFHLWLCGLASPCPCSALLTAPHRLHGSAVACPCHTLLVTSHWMHGSARAARYHCAPSDAVHPQRGMWHSLPCSNRAPSW